MQTINHDVSMVKGITNLVSKSTTKKIPKKYGGKPMNVINNLIAEREAWENGLYKRSNESLYSILQKCYGFYKSMEGKTETAIANRKAFRECVEQKGYKFSASTHTITKIVKCVFGEDRRRVSAYSIALRVAHAKNKGVLDIVEFLRQSGGVEVLRLAKNASSMSPTQKADIAKHKVLQTKLGTVKGNKLGGKLDDAGRIGRPTILIGTWEADASIVVRAVVESDTVMKAALASYYRTIKGEVKTKAAEQTVTDISERKKKAVEAAAATATVAA